MFAHVAQYISWIKVKKKIIMSSTVDDRNLNPMIKIGNSHISILQNSDIIQTHTID